MAEHPPGKSQGLNQDSGDATQEAKPAQAGNGAGEGSQSGATWLARTWAARNVSLSRVQAIVGLLAGIISVTGALYSVTQFFRPAPGMGEVVAVVQESKAEKGVSDATIEILTPQNALVATLTPDSLGQRAEP